MGDQPAAIDTLVAGIENGIDEQVLLGVTGGIAAYKIPKYILFLDALPLNGTGKVDTAATIERARKALGI